MNSILNNSIVKGLIATLISLCANTIATHWPETGLQWEIFGITALATVLLYFGQSVFLPATSSAGQLDGRDYLKALLVSVGSALSSFAASGITGTHVDFAAIGKLIFTTILLYLAKNFITPPPKAG